MSWLLSDEFDQFSKEIQPLSTKKKQLKKELKEFWERTNAEIDLLEKQAEESFMQYQNKYKTRKKI